MKVFIVNVNRCSGCYSCQMTCKDENCGNDWTPYAKPQPETGQFWLKLNDYVRGQVPQVKTTYVPVMCQHCDNAACLDACPVSAIYRRDDGLIIIDPKKCTGCQLCIDACPYSMIYFNPQFGIAQKCTGCAHLIDRGWTEPRCVDICSHESLKFGEESDFSSEISQSEILHPEYGLKPRVHYLGLPKRFVAGTVYDPATKEIIKDAVCTITGEGGPFTVNTDEWGDFWFNELGQAVYSLTIEAGGKSYTQEVDTTFKDIGLGDIPLS